MDARELEAFGLSKNEAKVYLSLVRHGASSAAEVVKDTGLHRVLVYDVLDRLTEKGLAGSILRVEKKFFEAAPPQELLERLKREEESIQFKKKELGRLLPELSELFSNIKQKQGVFFFKGKKGIKAALLKMVSVNEPIITIGSSGRTREVLGADFRIVRETIERKKIPIRMLYYESAREKKDLGFRQAKLRFLPEKYKNPLFFDVAGHISVMILLDAEPFAILIENQSVADSFRRYFEFLWGVAKN